MSKTWKDMVGVKYGSLTLLGVEKVGSKYPGLFICDCGQKRLCELYRVRRGELRSCGCQRASNISKGKTKHGMVNSSEYRSWLAMKERCTNPNNKGYSDYGGRGIKVCKRWLQSFENFYYDMGVKPSPEHTIERKNVNWGYVPSNCVWATRLEQNRNTRSRKNATGYTGVIKSGKNSWVAQISVNYEHLYLGTFSSPQLASQAYKAAKLKHHTSFLV